MARSLLRQLEQIRWSYAYSDTVSGVNDGGTAEPAADGSLEGDLNVIRTLVKQTKGTSYWYTDLGSYFDPTNTTSGSEELKELNVANLKNHTLDANTIIVSVTHDNSGSGHSVSPGDTGVLLPITTRYATPNNRMGLPIFASTANNGSYWDEGGSDNVCRIDIININTDAELEDGSGNTIYAKFHDGEDFAGTGDGTDVYARFYANDAVTTMVSGVSEIAFIYPHRKRLTDMEEYEWLRTDFINSWEGDIELIEDITNLWSYTGASNDVTDPTWDNTAANYILASNPTDLTTAINLLNTQIGDRNFTDDNYLTDGQTTTASLDALDIAVADIQDQIDAGMEEKYVESVASDITAGNAHTLPNSLTYTPTSTSGSEGANMDVYVDGQLLSADTGTNGANADRDYGETSTTSITFRFDVLEGRNITYMIRQ